MKKSIRQRKAQITVFMVLGIILLFSTALIFYIKGKVQVPESELKTAVEEIPEALNPVRQTVEECMQQKLSEGITKAMQQAFTACWLE